MGSDMELITPQTVPKDWSIHGFRQVIGQSSDSHAGLVRTVILTQDWPAHGFWHGTGWSTGTLVGLVSTPACQQSVPHPEPSAGSFPQIPSGGASGKPLSVHSDPAACFGLPPSIRGT